MPYIYRMVLFDDYIYIFYNISPEYPTKVKLEKEELQALRDLSHKKAEKDAENKESTPFELLKFKLVLVAERIQTPNSILKNISKSLLISKFYPPKIPQ